MTKYKKTHKLDLTMAQEVPFKVKINLSSTEGSSITNAFFKWAITGGKLIIIVVEFVALGVFFYKIIVQQQIQELHDQTEREKTILKSETAQEAEYRSLQDRLSNIKSIVNKTDSMIKSMYKIASISNDQQFTLQNLTINQQNILITANSSSVFNIAKFLEEAKKEKFVSLISINSLEKDERGFNFNLTIQTTE